MPMSSPPYCAAALVLAVASALQLDAQTVAGRVTGDAGEPLAYASIELDGGERGATTAADGTYEVTLAAKPPSGSGDSVTLTFRYIGYRPAVRRVARPEVGADLTLDVALTEATYTLDAATVRAGAEDPAYRIMREAAARRLEYLTAVEAYAVDVYVKGQVRVVEAPERILGQEIGDMGGLLDSSRAGIVYLSETYSELAARPPDDVRETIVASKVSGDPRGYSFNTAAGVDFDLYRRVSDYGKPVLTVLAENAPGTYRFRLLGSRRDEAGRLVHRIAVAPREGDYAPAYHGEVYVEEGSFHLVDADLYLLGTALGGPGLDTLFIAQSYRRRPQQTEDDGATAVWEVTQRRVEPVFSLLSFAFRGVFTAVYSDYDYAPAWAGPDADEPAPFGRVVTEVLPESNEVDSGRFAARPIPLTPAERLDYRRKDSVRLVRESPAFRDSVEARRNRLDVGAIGGYSHSDWRKRTRWTVASPLTQNGYHTATGLRLGLGVSYAKAFDEERTRELEVGGAVGYGIGDGRWYPTAHVAYRWNRRYLRELSASGGRELADYHRLEPVSASVNALYNAFAKRNPLKVYERRFAQVEHATDLHGPGAPPVATLRHALRFERRLARANVDDWSLLRRDRTYEPNLPEVAPGVFAELPTASLLGYAGEVSFTPGQRFLARPDGFIPVRSGGPTLRAHWRYGVEVGRLGVACGRERIHYLFAGLELRRDALRIARLGYLSARLGGGAALLDEAAHPIDLQLFGGSELNVNTYSDYLTRFLALPHYGLATRGPWVDGVVEHDFGGWIWRRLPLLRRLGWQVVTRAGGIYEGEAERTHVEVGVGLTNVGIGPARFLRVDLMWPYAGGERAEGIDVGWAAPVWRLGVNVPAELLFE